jgi:predicted RNase H-like HicB family nuclease
MDRIRVHYWQDEDTWAATSPDVPRWTAVADTYDEVRQLAEEGVRFALERDDVIVEHLVPVPARAS